LNIIIPTLSGKFSDTIGAGDTFLASFLVFYSQSKDLRDAVEQASYYTYRFLTEKNTIGLQK
jgi:sugar/nucleoside kinase (ribokinase family)